MECASVMAASQRRDWNAYYFLYSEDTLLGEQWQMNVLREEKGDILRECLKIALQFSATIS